VELKTKTLLIKVENDCQRDKGQAIAVLRWVCVCIFIFGSICLIFWPLKKNWKCQISQNFLEI